MSRQATHYERMKWLRRAETIQRKAAELLADMIEVVGVEHGVTDSADGVVEQAENLTTSSAPRPSKYGRPDRGEGHP